MSNLLAGKKGLVVGVANKRSIAWAIAQAFHDQGAEVALTYQNERLAEKVRPLAATIGQNEIIQCDLTNEADIEAAMQSIASKWGRLDFVVHAVAFANADHLKGEYLSVDRAGFDLALGVSAHTFTALLKAARPLLIKAEDGASAITLSYLGAERVIPGYNIMGVAKAALECSVRYLAHDLGPEKIRVNAISAGPINTLAARGIGGFTDILKHVQAKSALKRNVDVSEVADAAVFLAGRQSRGVTGEILHVDAGYSTAG